MWRLNWAWAMITVTMHYFLEIHFQKLISTMSHALFNEKCSNMTWFFVQLLFEQRCGVSLSINYGGEIQHSHSVPTCWCWVFHLVSFWSLNKFRDWDEKGELLLNIETAKREPCLYQSRKKIDLLILISPQWIILMHHEKFPRKKSLWICLSNACSIKRNFS